MIKEITSPYVHLIIENSCLHYIYYWFRKIVSFSLQNLSYVENILW
jgi:hypothetical protein